MTTTDANGIAFVEETDAVSPLHTLLNTLQSSTSNAVGSALRGPLPAANNTERDAWLTLLGSSAAHPLWVDVAGSLWRHDGTSWKDITGSGLALATFTLSGSAPNGTLVQLTPTLVGGANGWSTTPGSNKIQVLTPGIYSFDAMVSIGAAATGRSLVSLVRTSTSIEMARYPIGAGDDVGSATGRVELPASGLLAVNVLQTTGATRTISGTATLTRMG